ncbi:MAG TPA: pyridoxal-phosphate dependent enzyme [Actinomycetota bacterium]|nr:pyridoxal-phosphate dependent enzyme [Actinomycetota bacterium]
MDSKTGPSGPARAIRRRLGPMPGLDLLPLAQVPTPVEEVDLSGVLGRPAARAWLKREDRSGAEMGGNKVRKLEWLLGAAIARGSRSVVTSGGVGSNHALATAYHAAEAGLEAHLAIFPHHVSDGSRRTLRAMCSMAAGVTFCPSDLLVPVVLAGVAGRLRVSGRRPSVIVPGGSQPVGTVGAVDLGLELAEQVAAGELDAPDAVFVPFGSGGTSVGLALGLQAGGVRCPVFAVRVYPLPLTSRAWLRTLAAGTVRLLRSAGAEMPAPDTRLLRVVGDQLGAGYAEPTEAAGAAREVGRALGIALEATYSGKAFAAFLDAAGSPAWRGRNLVFVLTYDARIPAGLEAAPDDVVPSPLRRYL